MFSCHRMVARITDLKASASTQHSQIAKQINPSHKVILSITGGNFKIALIW